MKLRMVPSWLAQVNLKGSPDLGKAHLDFVNQKTSELIEEDRKGSVGTVIRAQFWDRAGRKKKRRVDEERGSIDRSYVKTRLLPAPT